jgi:hypothetical protein
MGKPQIAIRIPLPLLAELNQYVSQTGTSKTDVVVSAIAAYLGSAESVPLSQRIAELEKRVGKVESKLETKSKNQSGWGIL